MDFHHPYKPYDVQTQLMEAIYATLQGKYKIGIFESPTGTGKTLLIICATMTWLRCHRKHLLQASEEGDESDSEPEWVHLTYHQQLLTEEAIRIKNYEKLLTELQQEYDTHQRHVEASKETKRYRKAHSHSDDQYLPDDYTLGDVDFSNASLTKEINSLLNKDAFKIELDGVPTTQIYFCSRTHSQLDQFAHQLALTSFPSVTDDTQERTKYVPLGSRKRLCVNPKVNQLGADAINDACLDLQKKQGCPFLPGQESSHLVRFANLAVAKVHDIEEVAEMGIQEKVCLYYGLRKSIDIPAEIVSLPYPMMFFASTRQALNIKLKDAVVVVDEAHNLMDTICGLYSVVVAVEDLERVVNGLNMYMKKFIKRLSSGNRIQLTKLTRVCQVICKYLMAHKDSPEGTEVKPAAIFGETNADLANIFALEVYLTKSKIAYKIEGYLEANEHPQPLLFKVVQFLRCVNNPQSEGKFFWSSGRLHYMLLDPSAIFEEVVSQARCVLLCGGTMEPVSDYYDYLFPQISPSEVNTFKCSHIIPPENLSVFPVQDFDFSYHERTKQFGKLSAFLLELCDRVPNGVVVFFSSYAFLAQAMEKLPIKSINEKKELFTEGPSVDLSAYATAANEKGAILFAVVGGKLSEGINFSDKLARAVVMVGMPYPNAFSGEIIAKKNYIEKAQAAKGATSTVAKQASQAFYENLCMRAINQSVGRSIRHAADYSTIYLLDRRYALPRIQQKLSAWVQKRIISADWREQTTEFFNQVR